MSGMQSGLGGFGGALVWGMVYYTVCSFVCYDGRRFSDVWRWRTLANIGRGRGLLVILKIRYMGGEVYKASGRRFKLFISPASSRTLLLLAFASAERFGEDNFLDPGPWKSILKRRVSATRPIAIQPHHFHKNHRMSHFVEFEMVELTILMKNTKNTTTQ